MKNFAFLSLVCVVVNLQANLFLNIPLGELDKLAKKYGTDKGSEGRDAQNYFGLEGWQYKSHNYARIYEHYFSCVRHEKIKFLEIGFLSGASARMWQEYFTSAELHFIDIKKEYFEKTKKDFSKRCHFHVVDQSNENDLRAFIAESRGEFDIVLDDGGHHANQQILSFKMLFPQVKSGGVYIIEDLHAQYIKYFGGEGSREAPKAGPNSAIYFLQMLVDDLNFSGARTGCADRDKCPELILSDFTYFQKHILSIHFYDSVCCIFKK